MKLRIKIGIALLTYATLGFMIESYSRLSSYYQTLASAVSGNALMSSFLSFFYPFGSSMLETAARMLWFGFVGFLGFVLIFYRKLRPKRKPAWIPRAIYQQKSLGILLKKA